MNRSTILALVGAVVILLLLFFVAGGAGTDNIDWKENYKSENIQPYGSKVIYTILDDYAPKGKRKDIKESLVADLPDNPKQPANYVFIGEAQFLDSADVQQLLKFVSNGNTAFISSKSLPYDLMFYVYFNECEDTPWNDYATLQDSAIQTNFYHEQLATNRDFNYKYIKNFRATSYSWNYIEPMYFCQREDGFVPLGYFENQTLEEYVNFAKIEYRHTEMPDSKGGTIYFHSNPIAFTNLQMLDEVGKEYADRVFSHLNDGNIYVDHYSQVSEKFSRRNNIRRGANISMSSESPLKYILDNKYLSGAWFSLVAMGILFLMFRSKRRQRTIPVIQPNMNTSLEYISTIGDLYLSSNNHKGICYKQMRNFLTFVRTKLNISTKNLDEKFVEQLSRKTGVERSQVENLIQFYIDISNSTGEVTTDTLKEFNTLLNTVYTKCR